MVILVQETDDAEYDCAYKVDHEILHGVEDADVQVAALDGICTAVCGLDYRCSYAGNLHRNLGTGGVQGYGSEVGYDKVFLHIHVKELVCGKFKEFPDYPYGHGKAECHQSHIKRRQLDEAASTVQDVEQGKPDGCAQKSVDGVEHGVPARNGGVIFVDLSKYFCSVNKQIDNDLKHRRNLYAKHPLKK